jgi:hypothetical protein
MGIRRIVYSFDAGGFREIFEQFIPQLELDNFVELQNKAYQLHKQNSITWQVLEDIGYSKDDIGKESNEFDSSGCVKFWILVLLSSFCRPIGFKPVDARSTRELLETLSIDEQTTSKLTWGRPLGHLLLPVLENKVDLDKNDALWPPWCKSYGSLGWLSAFEIQPLQKTLKELSLAKLNIKEQTDYRLLINTLDSAIQNDVGLFLGVSA